MSTKLDDKDQKILEILKDHAEYTARQVARVTGLPATTVHNRITKLRNTGVIKKYTIVPDYIKLDKNFVAYILLDVNIAVLKEKNRSQYDLMAELKKQYFVERVDIVTGGTDMIVVVRVKDAKEFDECLLKKLQMIEGISNTKSMIVIHSG